MCPCDMNARRVCRSCRARYDDQPWSLAAWQRRVIEAERPATPEPAARVYVGALPDGVLPGVPGGIPILVTVHDAEGIAEVAFKTGEGRFARWGIPTELSEETA